MSSLSQSLTFAPSQLSSALTQNKDAEIQTMKKQLRQKEAEFMKDKALLVQQVELLRMQLSESGERETNLKKMNENIMNALQNHQSHSPIKQTLDIDEEHPKVIEILRSVKQEHLFQLQQERERHREVEFSLDKQIQQLQFQIHDQNRQYDILTRDFQNKAQELTTLQSNQQNAIALSSENMRREYETTVKRLNNELETINSDVERQVIQRVNERLVGEQDYNETIIRYQKEQQVFLDEQKEFRMKVEQQEKEMSGMMDRWRLIEDENGGLKYKIKQMEKKAKDDIEAMRKHKEDAVKKVEYQLEQLKKTKQPFKSGSINNRTAATSATTNTLKSRNKQSLYDNKENIQRNNCKTEDQEDINPDVHKLMRQLAAYRCQIKKMEIDFKDFKYKAQQEVAKLKDKLNVERKKRMNLYEDKIDKNNQLLQDLLDKDHTIIQQSRQITKLQDIVSVSGHDRSKTPNHLLNSLQESMVHPNALTQSMVDYNNLFGHANSSKRLISPLRSLDFTTMLNSGGSNMSFLLPIQKRDKSTRRKANMLSPKQIKRNRIHSVKVPGQMSTSSSINGVLRVRKLSRDGSIAEVNEDLYKDSVESPNHDDINLCGDSNVIDKTSIVLPYEKNRKYHTQKLNNDDELTRVLMNDKLPNQEVYFDSLDMHSSDLEQQQETFSYQSTRFKNQIPASIMQPRQILQDITKNKKHKKKDIQEDEDCLVNILDQEETNIEVQPTLMHTRQHLSTENLFKEISNTIETLQSFRNLRQKQNSLIQKQPQNALPKPYQTLQKGTVTKILKLQETHQKFDQMRANMSNQKPEANYGDKLMKSPSSPNIQSLINKANQINQSSSSSGKMLRVDSCPSPLDEHETIMEMCSGEKLRIKEVNQSKFDLYHNQFNQQRAKMSATIKPPASNKNKQLKPQPQQQFAFRTRTNSLINSVCSEISFKMKFMPNNNDQSNIHITTQHSRVPSTTYSTNSIMKALSPRHYH